MVEIYSAPKCVHCETVKNLCKARDIEYIEKDIAEVLPKEWIDRIGFVPRSVPQVFVNGEYVGGAVEFKAVLNGNAQ